MASIASPMTGRKKFTWEEALGVERPPGWDRAKSPNKLSVKPPSPKKAGRESPERGRAAGGIPVMDDALREKMSKLAREECTPPELRPRLWLLCALPPNSKVFTAQAVADRVAACVTPAPALSAFQRR